MFDLVTTSAQFENHFVYLPFPYLARLAEMLPTGMMMKSPEKRLANICSRLMANLIPDGAARFLKGHVGGEY